MQHSRLASPAATREVLSRHGLRARKSLGQHFLVDDNVVGRILDLARVPAGAPVLEVGPGIGTLTVALCEVAGAVVAVERDSGLLEALKDTTGGCDSLVVVHGDAVKVPAEALITPMGPPVALVANLPYSVAATVVLRLLQDVPSLVSATVMVQAEVADRMCAEPGGKDYGAYTVKLRLLCEPAGRFPVPPGCFLPPPRVDSAVVRLDRVERDEGPGLVEAAGRLATAAFAQRRKTLRNSLASSSGVSPSDLDAMLTAAGIDGGRRAETLSVDEYLGLAREAVSAGWSA